ncbi:MAG: hypothetical protein JXX28_00705 [Deltaproteobacteria bacterium]|nr:hypothetical protein [Deltaproteobacteria bacterium]
MRLEGEASDYDALLSYINVDSPEASALLAYADGLGDHPPVWSEGSEERAAVLAWIAAGAPSSCEATAEEPVPCALDTDCPVVACPCAGGDVAVQACEEGSAGERTCLSASTCVEETWEVCPVVTDARLSFSADIVPSLRADCASCHGGGQHGVRLAGSTSDYAEVMRYVDVNAPEEDDSFLWWAAGGGRHPISWPPSGAGYSTFLLWVEQGAQNN